MAAENRNRRTNRLLIMLGIFAVLLFGTALTASAAATIDQQQSAATEKSITVKWGAVSGADFYRFSYWPYSNGASKAGAVYKTVYGASCTFSAAKDTTYYCDVEAFNAAGTKIDEAYYYRPCTTAPGKVTGFKAESWGTSKGGTFVLKSNPYPNTMKGVEWRLLSQNGKKVLYNGTTTYDHIYASSASLSRVYRLAVRGYSSVNNKKFYGPWYSKVIVPQPKLKDLKLASGSRIKVGWKKVAGATKYIIYGSTSRNSGYKKIAAVSKNKTGYVVSKVKGKKLKKYKTYYFKVRAVCGSAKSVMSSIAHGYIYNVYK